MIKRIDDKEREERKIRESGSLILLVRHGQSEGNLSGVLSRNQNELPLTAFGVRQAEFIAKELLKIRVDEVVSSPLLRARQTAEIIAREVGKNLSIESRLNERDFGKLDGSVVDKYTWRFEREKGMESFEDIWKRVESFMDSVGDESVVVGVTHGDTIRAPTLKLLGLDEISGFGLRVYNANITVIEKRISTYEVVTFDSDDRERDIHSAVSHKCDNRYKVLMCGIPLINDIVIERIPDRFRNVSLTVS